MNYSKQKMMQLVIVLILASAISATALPVLAGETSSLKQEPSLRDLLEMQTKAQLVDESVMLYDYIDWQESRLEECDAKVINRDAALRGCGQSSCGWPVTEVIVGVLVGGLAVALLD